MRIARDQPVHVEAAVEELLRWLSIVNTATTRTATEPVQIAGQRIEAGQMVIAFLPAANRDPALVPGPGVLDLTRGAIGHLAFGHGVHHCLGGGGAKGRVPGDCLLPGPDRGRAAPAKQAGG